MKSTVVYRGPSRLEPGVTIVGLVSYWSVNTKNGPMSQLWILRDDIAPHHAQKLGLDHAVCGNCPYRPVNAKATGGTHCYVITYQGPRSVWEATRGQQVNLQGTLDNVRANAEHGLRLGAYGDPAALPLRIIASLHSAANGRTTGYTHDWKHPRSAELRSYCMASCDSPADYARAKAEGWRTFRVLLPMAPTLAKREIICPSDVTTCSRCRLCDGKVPGDNRKDVAIMAH